LIEQLNSKHSEMMVYYEELNKKTQQEEDASRLPEMQRYIGELELKNHEMIERFSYEANELNSSILALRTTNLSLRNELENKEDAINELKHQLFNAELRTQKEKTVTGSMINSISGPISRDTEAERLEREKLLVSVVVLSAEVESLRLKN
jgi:predicted RNase H-like nuclease (RuvC/YqgF family)